MTHFNCDNCAKDITGRKHVLPEENLDVLCEECGEELKIRNAAPKMHRMLEWLLYQAGHKDGRIPPEECAMIENLLNGKKN